MDEELMKALKALGDSYNDGIQIQTDKIADISDRLEAIEASVQRPGYGANKLADKAFEAFIRGGRESLTDEYRNSLIVSDDSKGGYIVAPKEVEAGILKTLTQFSPIRRYATVRTISSPGVSIAKQLTAPEASWVGETAERSETTMSYGRLDIPVHTLSTYIDVSLEFLEDSAYDVIGEITTEFGKAFAKKESAAHINGDGVKKPLGIMNTEGVTDIASGNATALTLDGLLDMHYDLPAVYAENAVHLARRRTIGAVRKAKSGDGQYLWTDSIIAGTPPSFNSRPMVEDPELPEIGAGNRAMVFGDLSYFKIYDRIGLNIMRDDYSRAKFGEVRFWGRRRTGAGLTLPEAVRTLKIGTSV
jgi:HK97 family phage major capsid protein